jgi:D-alanyl-D-alanine carboxypeptidase
LTLVQRLERYVYDRPLLFAPGSAQRYFNPGYDLLGLMAERASGETLQQLTARLILQPLALSHSSFENRDDPACARGYAFTSEGLLLDVTEEDKANVNGFSPSGGMVATIGDVQAMFRALFGGRIINQTSLDMMTRGEGTIRSGLFFTPSESGREAYGHQGALIGESTRALYFPNLDAIVVGTQNSNGRTDDVALLNRFLD